MVSNGEEFIDQLNILKIKNFTVGAFVSEFGKGGTLTTRYITSFIADTPEAHIEYNILHYEAKGELSPVEKENFKNTGIITADKTLEDFIKKYGEKMGGMSITGPMAEMSKEAIKKITHLTPFSRPK